MSPSSHFGIFLANGSIPYNYYSTHWRRIILFIISILFLFIFYNFLPIFGSKSGQIFLMNFGIERENNLRKYPSACFDPWVDELEEFMPHFNQSNLKYISNNPKVPFCSGLGNQMFRLASLYGLGRQLGRMPAFSSSTRCPKSEQFVGELDWIFPFRSKFIKYINFNNKNQTHFATKFAIQNCCHFDDPKRGNLSEIFAKNLILGGIYLQNFHYFHAFRQSIKSLFRFSPSLCACAMNEGRRVFGADHPSHSHKLCVHTRRGDFFKRKWQSTKEFTQKGLEFSVKKLRQKFPSISIVLLGDDKQFLRNLSIQKNLTQQIFIPEQNGRGEDMAFAVLSCDSLLITASASTFAWWIGYLMKPKGHILFNADFTGMDRDRHNFLPEWIPIRLDPKSGQINEIK